MIRYLGTPSTPEIRHAMQMGLIDTMTGPYQGNVLPGRRPMTINPPSIKESTLSSSTQGASRGGGGRAMSETFRRLDDVRVVDPADDHYGEQGCIGAVDHGFAPGRPYCVNFESTSRWYGPDEIVSVFALDSVRADLERASGMLDSLVGKPYPDQAAVVHALDRLRRVVENLVAEVEKIAAAVAQ